MAITEIKVPDIGEFEDVEVIEVLVAPGDAVKAEESLITLESDKASMEIPSPSAGTVKEVVVQLGDKLSEGDLIVRLEAADEPAAEPAPAEQPAAPAAEQPEATPAPTPTPTPTPPPVAAPAAAVHSSYDVQVPEIGDFDEVEVIEVLVAVGDTVQEETSLITLESDKASMEIPSPKSGTVKNVHVSVGDRVGEGALIVTLDVTVPVEEPVESSVPPAPATEPAVSPTAEPPPAPAATPAVTSEGGLRSSPTAHLGGGDARPPHASPAVRRFARELGADLSLIQGSGPKSRILKDDVKAFVKQAMGQGGRATSAASQPAQGAGIPPIPTVDFSKWGDVEVSELSRIKKLSGAHLHRAWLNVPHVTHHDEADITELEAFRKSLRDEADKRGVRVTALAFIMKAVAAALAEFPTFNASLNEDGSALILKKYFHIGIAVDTPNGLVVPVFKDVDQKSIFDLAAEMGEVSVRAREGKLSPGDLQGGCISISSLGGIGGTAFTPIVNAPEVAILGVARARMTPVWNGSEFQPRLMLPLDLSYDHRVIDGAEAARFVAHLVQLLSDVRRLLL